MNDKQLLELLQSDPQRGLAKAVDIYSAYVMKIAYTKLSGICTREDIEEAVSDIFMAFYTSGRKCGFEIRSVTAFISLIAERHCLNVFKKALSHEKELPLDNVDNAISEQENSYSGSALSDALVQLGEPDTSIFIRKYFFGQKSKDIARELNMKTNTVNQRISRGLKKLKKILEEEA